MSRREELDRARIGKAFRVRLGDAEMAAPSRRARFTLSPTPTPTHRCYSVPPNAAHGSALQAARTSGARSQAVAAGSGQG
ncbi:hypothetical protein U9M48_017534 [Paspalum notatum var. saurae]|uniref:Uncharacterized protein n=1 Tax=Paspalum notatum var. saurae TaxID=547442 RepID=A0AAQ3T837_PASNO